MTTGKPAEAGARGRLSRRPASRSVSLRPRLAVIGEKFRRRPDSEHEMILNRLVIAVLITAYLLVAAWFNVPDVGEPLVVSAVFSACSIAFFCHLLIHPGASVTRRVLAMVVDLGMLSWGMHVADEITALLYPMYLWTIFGNGFRFGVKYLFLAMTIGVAGFSVVVAITEYWRMHLHLAVGLLAGLVILPLYAAQLIRKLSAARQQAEEASQAKTRFLASVSHELRTPLNAIIGLSDLLRDGTSNPEQHGMSRTIGTAGRSLLSLINSLLDFARIEERRITSNLHEFDLHALLMHVRAILSVQAHAKSVRFAVHITRRTPRFIKTDKHHLEEMLVNLGGNAVKFTERGHVVIAVDAVEQNDVMRLRCEVSDTGIGIAPEAQARIFDSFTQADETIIDRFGGTGLGLAIVKQLVEFYDGEIGVESSPGVGSTFWFEIDAAKAETAALELPRWGGSVVLLSPDPCLCDLLEAAGAEVKVVATADRAGDMVIALRQQGVRRPVVVVDAGQRAEDGVSAVQCIIDRQRGEASNLVLVADELINAIPSRGLRPLFVTALERPLATADLAVALRLARGDDNSALAEIVREAAPDIRRPLAILVAEDNRTNQMVISKILQRAGHEVHLVDNGEQALDALEQQAFDIVLMDVNMPVMNGIEATKLYRFSSLGSKHVPIVALTADATAEARARCEAAGMDGCATKPIEPERLLELIDSMVASAAAAAAAAEDAEAENADRVAHISEHPRYQAGPAPCVDPQKLDDLQTIGGKDFVTELVAQFAVDAAGIVEQMAAAAREGNTEAFRERAHALRSSAANIGANGVFDMCVEWRQISAAELSADGSNNIARLNAELAKVMAALAAHVDAMLSRQAPAATDDAPLSRPA